MASRLSSSQKGECEICDEGTICVDGRRYVCPFCRGKTYRRPKKGRRVPLPCDERYTEEKEWNECS